MDLFDDLPPQPDAAPTPIAPGAVLLHGFACDAAVALLQAVEAVLQQAPNDYDSLKNLAILFQQAQRWPEALDAARQAQAVAPEAEQPSWGQFITDLETQMAAQN